MSWPDWHRVLISGARDYPNAQAIRSVLEILSVEHGDRLLIIEGEADGADKTARVIAEELSIHVARVHALWDTRYGSAGPQRNTAMLALQPHELICFHPDLSKSKGTRNMYKQAEKAHIPTTVIP